jgi:protein-tyrosine kinase
MTILETALERAKQLRAHQPAPAPQAQVQTAVPAARRRVEDAEPIAAPVVFAFQRLEPDPGAVAANRVLLAPSNTLSGVADAYRILRTRLSHRLQSQGWNSLAVTSAGPSEGKSLTALNLSVSIASERKRNVFLLDLDLRKPSLCKYLGIYPQTTIGEYLSGEAKLEDVFFSIDANLMLASGLRQYHNSADLLGSERLLEMLAYIRNADPNALVIADLPPLLSIADALVVAPKLSATLLVVAESGTRREGLTRAREILAGVTLAGVVLNHAKTAIHSYYS